MSFNNEDEPTSFGLHKSRLEAIIGLLEKEEATYIEKAITVAKGFLDCYAKQTFYSNWEMGMHLKEFFSGSIGYLPYSACAFHILLKYDKENAIAYISKWLTDKLVLQPQTLNVIYYHLREYALPIFKLALKNSNSGMDQISTTIHLLIQHFTPQAYIGEMWNLVGNKSKNIKELVTETLAEKDPDAESKAIALLDNKKAQSRLSAATILAKLNSPAAQFAIGQTIDQEPNDNVRDVLLATVLHSMPAQPTELYIKEMVESAKTRGKLSQPIEPWLNEEDLPPLFYTAGKQLSNNEIRFLFYRMGRIKEMRSDMEAKYIIQLLDKEKATDFANAIIRLYIANGAKPEHKYLLALVALLGSDAGVDKIRTTINKWLDESRYKMAEHGVGALALQGSDKALRWVEWYSRKYKSKTANVGAAAMQALENASQELGITTYELGDKIVPDFGFDGLFKHFTIGNEEYRAFIDSNFKMAFFNEDNKKLKAVPTAADPELKEELKAIGKEVRDIVKSQSSRLEYYLMIQRRWPLEQWQKFFMQNPVMFIYATKLLWAVYNNNNGNIIETFVCNEDTSLLNVEGDEITLNEKTTIGMVHPSQLSAAVLQQWKQQFFDLSIHPVFSQLDRVVPDMNDIDLSKTIIKKFNGKHTKENSIRATLEKFGWHKGPTGDGGMLQSYNLLYSEKKMEAVLEIEGVGAGYGWGGEEKLGKLYFVDKTQKRANWYGSMNEDDEILVPLKTVPSIFLSETIAAIEAIKPKESS